MANLSPATTAQSRTQPPGMPARMPTRPAQPSFAQRNPAGFSWLMQLKQPK